MKPLQASRLALLIAAMLSVGAIAAQDTQTTPPDPAAQQPAPAATPADAPPPAQPVEAQPATVQPAEVPPVAPPADTPPAPDKNTPPPARPTSAGAVLPAAGESKAPAALDGKHEAPPVAAAQQDQATPKQLAEAVAQTSIPGDPSGFRLMTLSTNALLSRVSLEDQAKKSLDMQYYIFKSDATGRLIALHALDAADRGVRVRMLIDDFNIDDAHMFAALDAHPNIEVRLFNAFQSPKPTMLSKTVQLLADFRHLNRRMHNKSFIVDGDVAIVGGRNIGDEYFSAREDSNFRDLDVIAIGPVVQEATKSFDTYWTSDATKPLAEFKSAAASPDDITQLRARLEKDVRTFEKSAYTAAAADDLPNGASADRPGNWYWGPSALIADQPEKIANGADRADLRISPEVRGMIQAAQSEVLVLSPYFIPSATDEEHFTSLAKKGVDFRILTNSLASTDEPAVHARYATHRKALVEGGVKLYELKPEPGVQISSAGTSGGVSLHAKAIVVDRRYVFIGSLNMDQRSKLLNTEMGVVVDSPQLAKAVAAFFETATLPENAYHVVLGKPDGSHPTDLHWQATKDGKSVDYAGEPDAGAARKVEAAMMKLLPIGGLL